MAGAPDPGAELALVGRFRSGRYDVALVMTSFSQSPYPAAGLCLLAGVPYAQVVRRVRRDSAHALGAVPATRRSIRSTAHCICSTASACHRRRIGGYMRRCPPDRGEDRTRHRRRGDSSRLRGAVARCVVLVASLPA